MQIGPLKINPSPISPLHPYSRCRLLEPDHDLGLAILENLARNKAKEFEIVSRDVDDGRVFLVELLP